MPSCLMAWLGGQGADGVPLLAPVDACCSASGVSLLNLCTLSLSPLSPTGRGEVGRRPLQGL